MVSSRRLDVTTSWLTPARISKVTGGRSVRSGAPAERITTDSRDISDGACFVALRGDRFDGHDYVMQALASGAAGAIVSEPIDRTTIPEGKFVVRVGDTHDALACIAAEHRRRSAAKVIGVTGSCGKTSTKDMLGAVLAKSLPTVYSPRSFNNQVGVPLSLLQIQPDTRAAVIEIGTSAPGEIAGLTAIASPDIGIVTCVSEAHLSGLGSLEGVAAEKGSLLEGLVPDGVAILNFDDRHVRGMAARCGDRRVVSVSAAGEADWFATDMRFHGLGTHFRLQGDRSITLPRLGSHNVYNALLVIAAATELGLSLEAILEALCEIPASKRRLESRECGDITVFDDTYNMNPDSSRAALAALAGIHRAGRKIVVFGEMAELGTRSEVLHRELGQAVAESDIDLLVTVGDRARWIADGAIQGGLPALSVMHASDVRHACEITHGAVRSGDLVLCKASRRIGLDRLVDDLVRQLALRPVPSSRVGSGARAGLSKVVS